MLKFIAFAVVSYLAGGLLGGIALRLFKTRARTRHLVASLLRLTAILITTAFGGLCIWIIATRVFFNPANRAIRKGETVRYLPYAELYR